MCLVELPSKAKGTFKFIHKLKCLCQQSSGFLQGTDFLWGETITLCLQVRGFPGYEALSDELSQIPSKLDAGHLLFR